MRRATVNAKRTDPRRDRAGEDGLVAIVKASKAGLTMTEVARAFDPSAKGEALDRLASKLYHNLQRLVREKRLRREGRLYLSAAKEAL